MVMHFAYKQKQNLVFMKLLVLPQAAVASVNVASFSSHLSTLYSRDFVKELTLGEFNQVFHLENMFNTLNYGGKFKVDGVERFGNRGIDETKSGVFSFDQTSDQPNISSFILDLDDIIKIYALFYQYLQFKQLVSSSAINFIISHFTYLTIFKLISQKQAKKRIVGCVAW